jgi:hypothetical protein
MSRMFLITQLTKLDISFIFSIILYSFIKLIIFVFKKYKSVWYKIKKNQFVEGLFLQYLYLTKSFYSNT